MKLSRISVGLAVRSAREAAELTLNDLAKLTGMTVPSLSRSENGLRDLEFAEVVAIANAVKLNLETVRSLAETFEYAGSAETARKKSELERDLVVLQRSAIEAAIEELNT
jgi:transcriptional regulator with XRE-family HTH domain